VLQFFKQLITYPVLPYIVLFCTFIGKTDGHTLFLFEMYRYCSVVYEHCAL